MTMQFKHFSYDNYIAVQITNCLVVHSQTKKAKRTHKTLETISPAKNSFSLNQNYNKILEHYSSSPPQFEH